MNRVVIVGGGASGLMAAITAAKNGAAVTILEKMEKPGKKLLVTGNGKCNLTNMEMAADYFRSQELPSVKRVLVQFDEINVLEFFHNAGMLTKDKAGCVYPYTEQAATVLEVLLLELRRYRVKLKCSEAVKDLKRQGNEWIVYTETWKYPCDCVILCAGGKAAPKTGSDGFGYQLAERTGHHVNPVLPALVPLKIRENSFKILAGLRSRARLKLEIDRETVADEAGELQWTEYGISGIVVFQLSRLAAAALAEEKQVVMHVDLLPDYQLETVMDFLNQSFKQAGSMEELLSGIFPKKMLTVLFERTNQKASQPPTAFATAVVLAAAKELRLTIRGTKSFDMAQVCAGGVGLDQINTDTLESVREAGLYFAGELLDADGICGGYNLQWAWSSGYLAGKAAAKR